MGAKGVYIDAETRFWKRLDRTRDDGCWVWLGAKDTGGYGRLMVEGRLMGVHQWAYRHFVGPVPPGLVLDHLCRNRACANPAHLEPVTRRENVLRGETRAAQEAAQTHCVNGHPFSPENTYVQAVGAGVKRRCHLCARANVARSGDRYQRQWLADEVERLRAENAALRAEIARLQS